MYDVAIMIRRIAPYALVALHATTGCARCNDTAGSADAASSASVGERAPTTSRTSSCDRVTAMSVCSEYSGAYLAQNEASLSASCAKLGGAFVGAECPNTAVLGTCVLSTTEVRKFYASGGATYDAARAEKECEGPYKGKWSPFR